MYLDKNHITAQVSQTARAWPWTIIPMFLTFFLLVLIRRAAVTVPFSDELHFNTLYGYLVNGSFPSITELLATHNGHPYLILKLIITAIFFLHLPWKILMYAQPLFLAWTFFIAVHAARLEMKSWRDILAYVALAVCIITPRIWEDLYWGMQLSAQMCLAFSLLSFSLVTEYVNNKSTKKLISVFMASFAAAMSAGAGIVVPPMIVAVVCFTPGERRRSHVMASCIFLVLSSALTFLCFKLSTEPGVGEGPLQLGIAGDHILRMLAHLYCDFSIESTIALWLGLFTGLVLGYLALKFVYAWPRHLFPILCSLLGIGLIVMITYARVRAGLFQPNAPRYVPAVLPLSIGLLLLLKSLDKKILFVFFASISCIGFAHAAQHEWRVSPYRKMGLNQLKTDLCDHHKSESSSNTAGQIADMHKLFCERRW